MFSGSELSMILGTPINGSAGVQLGVDGKDYDVFAIDENKYSVTPINKLTENELEIENENKLNVPSSDLRFVESKLTESESTPIDKIIKHIEKNSSIEDDNSRLHFGKKDIDGIKSLFKKYGTKESWRSDFGDFELDFDVENKTLSIYDDKEDVEVIVELTESAKLTESDGDLKNSIGFKIIKVLGGFEDGTNTDKAILDQYGKLIPQVTDAASNEKKLMKTLSDGFGFPVTVDDIELLKKHKVLESAKLTESFKDISKLGGDKYDNFNSFSQGLSYVGDGSIESRGDQDWFKDQDGNFIGIWDYDTMTGVIFKTPLVENEIVEPTEIVSEIEIVNQLDDEDLQLISELSENEDVNEVYDALIEMKEGSSTKFGKLTESCQTKISGILKKLVENENGVGEIKTYADMVIYNDKGELLLLKRTVDEEVAPNQWGLAGGKVEDGETTEEAAIREANEESGLTFSDVKRLKEFTNDGSVSHYYSGLSNSEEVVLSEEHSEYAWVKPEQLGNYDIIFGNVDRYKELASMVFENKELTEAEDSEAVKKREEKLVKIEQRIKESKEDILELKQKLADETNEESIEKLKTNIEKEELVIKNLEDKLKLDKEIEDLKKELAGEEDPTAKEKIKLAIDDLKEKKDKIVKAFENNPLIKGIGDLADELLKD